MYTSYKWLIYKKINIKDFVIDFALQYMVIDFLEWLNKKVGINFVYTSEVCNGCVMN